MAILTAEALAKKAHALQAKLSKQRARMIAKSGQIRISRGPSGVSGPAFAAGFKFGSSIFGRPKSSIRAKSLEGMTSFHFKLTPVTRGSSFTEHLSGRSATKPGGSTTSAPTHQVYIERDQAVETVAKEAKAKAQAVREQRDGPEIGESLSHFLMTPEDPGYSESAALYMDRDGAVENRSSFGNIAETLEERVNFWKLVEESERRPSKHSIIVNSALDPEFWQTVVADQSAPKFLKEIALNPSDAIITESVAEKVAAKIYDYFLAHRAVTSEDAQPIAFAPWRGGRVQNRLIIDLPADMTPLQRLEIAQQFCDQQFAKKGAPFHCAIHRPTKSNDERHYHMHITFHDRPASKMIDPSTGLEAWDFEIIERKRDSSRHYSKTRSHQQEKIRDFQDIKWPRQARKIFSEIVNAVRKQNGMAPIYDHRKYSEMGILYEVLPNLTRGEFHDVQRGLDNPNAALKVDKRWQRALIKEAEDTEMVIPHKGTTKRFLNLIANVSKRAPASIVMAKAAHGAYLVAISQINDARLDRVALKIAIDQELSALTPEFGSPSSHSKSMKGAIEQLHLHLAKPLHDQEILARESQRLAIGKLALLEKQLGTISLGSISLAGRSFTDLMGRAGLSAVMHGLQFSASQIEEPAPPPTPAPAPIRVAVAPVVAPTPVAQPARTVPPVAYTPPPSPKLIDPGMAKLRELSRKAMSSPAPAKPPIQATILKTQPSAPVLEPKTPVPARTPAPPATTSFSPKFPPKTVVEPQPRVSAAPQQLDRSPIKRTVTSPSSLNHQKEGLSITDTVSTKAPGKITNPENSPTKPDPETKPSVTTAAPAPPILSEAEERLEKERRDRRRAILTNPPRGRGWER
ncbi:MobA/MobL family protein [uncultured Rhodoblastus sp.]|uniref:MobA/MobL family protein n=1 Tax=uncultured Rhodoblastus sp. TaxID=543037 RepID=UPI0025FF0830|nr:MobA/MobL family protein [uncultured Rhodoblastus sp.]